MLCELFQMNADISDVSIPTPLHSALHLEKIVPQLLLLPAESCPELAPSETFDIVTFTASQFEVKVGT